jgi:hypothetical protein
MSASYELRVDRTSRGPLRAVRGLALEREGEAPLRSAVS